MSLDNVIAIAGAEQNAVLEHQIYYVAFGLVVSVPIIIWGGTLVLMLIDQFPSVVLFGTGLLGWIAGGILVTDVFAMRQFGAPSTFSKLAAKVMGAIFVVIVGKWLAARKRVPKIQSQESA